jgi:glyoxylase-like metal-dependent hydrolase (beta-lactamase superfamily II)
LPQSKTPPPKPAAKPKYYPNGDPGYENNPPGVRNTDSCLPLDRAKVTHDYACDGPAPGDIAFRWIHGSVTAAKNTDPRVQVLAYNEDTYILRQNVCIAWQAPFNYLLFGNAGALLIDTGATAEAEWFPLRKTVDAIVARWCGIRLRQSIPLTIVMTSSECAAQNRGLGQFAGRADTTLAPAGLAATRQFLKLTGHPGETGSIDLGGRQVTVIPTPGTHKDGVTFYDTYTRFLFTGDLLFPGRIQIANDRDYVASLARLGQWAATHKVKWVMGGHIDMMFVPGRAYPRFATYKPYERLLQMEPKLIGEALLHARRIEGRPDVAMRADFHLLNRVGPDEKIYRTSPEMPDIPVSIWLP